MRIAIDSEDLPPTSRLDSWRGMICDTYIGLDAHLPDAFRAVVEGHLVGENTLTRITSNRHDVERSSTLIKRDGLDLLFFGVPLAGRAFTIQAGREVALEPGSIIIKDSSRPFRTYVDAAADVIWLSVPKKPMAERISGVEDLVATSLRPKRPFAPILTELMAWLDRSGTHDCPDSDADGLVVGLLDLLALAIATSSRLPAASHHLMPRPPLH